MSIGNGIAIAGLWLFAGACAISKDISGTGLWVAMILATVLTFVLK